MMRYYFFLISFLFLYSCNNTKNEQSSSLPLEEKDWGFLDEKGKPLTQFVYDNVRDFADGLAVVEKNGALGFINKTGELFTIAKNVTI